MQRAIVLQVYKRVSSTSKRRDSPIASMNVPAIPWANRRGAAPGQPRQTLRLRHQTIVKGIKGIEGWQDYVPPKQRGQSEEVRAGLDARPTKTRIPITRGCHIKAGYMEAARLRRCVSGNLAVERNLIWLSRSIRFQYYALLRISRELAISLKEAASYYSPIRKKVFPVAIFALEPHALAIRKVAMTHRSICSLDFGRFWSAGTGLPGQRQAGRAKCCGACSGISTACP